MTDQFDELTTQGQQAPTAPEEISEGTLTETVAVPEITDDDLFDEGEADEETADENVVTLRTTGGDNRYVPVDGPTSLVDILNRARISFDGVPTFWLNSAEIQPSAVIPVGATVTIVGSVKGGAN